MNWMEFARRELSEGARGRTAKTAETTPLAVPGLRPPAEPGGFVSFGSAPWGLLLESDPLREAFEERAAIMEFDGQLTREDAEWAAWALVSAPATSSPTTRRRAEP